MPSPQRFMDTGHTKYHFLDHVLVRCPRCAGVARVAPAVPPAAGTVLSLSARRRFVCRGCGSARDATRSGLRLFRERGEATDPFFGLPLWLQAETRHGRVWAYNPEHLEVIRRFVAAPLRERAPWDAQVKKMTLVARLPSWIKSAKNRDEVLRAVERIRSTLG